MQAESDTRGRATIRMRIVSGICEECNNVPTPLTEVLTMRPVVCRNITNENIYDIRPQEQDTRNPSFGRWGNPSGIAMLQAIANDYRNTRQPREHSPSTRMLTYRCIALYKDPPPLTFLAPLWRNFVECATFATRHRWGNES